MALPITWKRTNKQSMARVAGCDLIAQYKPSLRRWQSVVILYGQIQGFALCDTQAEAEQQAEAKFAEL